MEKSDTFDFFYALIKIKLKKYDWFGVHHILYHDKFDTIVLKMKNRNYINIIDEILDDIPIDEQINFCERFKEDIPYLSVKYNGSNRLEWSHILRVGELMIEQAVTLKVWVSTASKELMDCAIKEISLPEIKYLSDKYNEEIPVYEIMNSIRNKKLLTN